MTMHFNEAAYLVHQAFRELAVHEMNLATSLQGLLPTNKEAPSKSAQYLYESGVMLKELTEKVKTLMETRSTVSSQSKSSS